MIWWYSLLATNNKFVNVVDDDLDITVLFQDVLSKHVNGFSIVSCNDPIFAFEHFIDNQKNYAMVIADLRMPGINGLELLKKIRKLSPEVRTMLMSAYEVDSDPVFRCYMKEGVIDRFLQKPITVRHLRQEVDIQLNLYQTQLKNFKKLDTNEMI